LIPAAVEITALFLAGVLDSDEYEISGTYDETNNLFAISQVYVKSIKSVLSSGTTELLQHCLEDFRP
jgi:hypothetical protein